MTQGNALQVPQHSLRVVSYNIHSCRGSDGRLRPDRVISVLRKTGADVAALQELGSLSAARNIAERMQMDLFFVAAQKRGELSYGNALLTRLSGATMHHGPLPQLHPRLEPRAAQWIRVSFRSECHVDIINTHLGLDPKERLIQTEELLGPNWLSRVDIGPHIVLCGDLNARPGSAPYARLCARLKDPQQSLARRFPTFPALFPVIRIDHVLTSPHLRVNRVNVPSDIIARLASDHRPLVVDISVGD